MKASFTAIVLAGTLLGGAIAHADSCSDGCAEELMGTDQTIRWSGVVWGTSSPNAPTAQTGCQNLPTAVAQAGDSSSFAGKVCDGFDLEIDLPTNVWSIPGGVQIAIKWEDPTFETIKDIDLFVFDSAGNLVGKSEGWVGEAESVMLPSLANGEYVVVAARDSLSALHGTTWSRAVGAGHNLALGVHDVGGVCGWRPGGGRIGERSSTRRERRSGSVGSW